MLWNGRSRLAELADCPRVYNKSLELTPEALSFTVAMAWCRLRARELAAAQLNSMLDGDKVVVLRG